MAEFNFPTSPSNDDTYELNGVLYTYDSTKGYWYVTNYANSPIGYTGSQGIIGYTGSLGYTGSIGYTGSQGPIGYTGSQGIQGYTGSLGYTGSQGDQGAIGYTGSASTVIGYTGSLGYTGSEGAGYTGSQGDTGYTGSAGSIGTVTLNDLNDVSLSSPAVGEALTYTGSNWINGEAGISTGKAIAMAIVFG